MCGDTKSNNTDNENKRKTLDKHLKIIRVYYAQKRGQSLEDPHLTTGWLRFNCALASKQYIGAFLQFPVVDSCSVFHIASSFVHQILNYSWHHMATSRILLLVDSGIAFMAPATLSAAY